MCAQQSLPPAGQAGPSPGRHGSPSALWSSAYAHTLYTHRPYSARRGEASAGAGTLFLNFLQSQMAEDRTPATFTDNFVRLLGLHALSQHFTAQLLGVSEATMSAWMNGKSTPSLAKAIDIAELFQITTDRL